jgi:hypothetical protein
MRVRRESLLLLGVLTAVCALAGIVAGIATGALVESTPIIPPTSEFGVIQPAAKPTLAPTPSIVTPSAPGEQWALLIIGVDDLNAAQPRFEGCWILTYKTGDTNYYAVSFPPDADYTVSGLDGTRTLAQVFAEDQRQQRGYAFMRDAIRGRFPAFQVDAELVLDRSDLAGLVTGVGGLTFAGQLQTSADLFHAYDNFAVTDEAARLTYQQQAFEALFGALRLQAWTAPQLADHLTQLPQLQTDTVRAAALAAYAAEAPAFADSTLNWTTLAP